MHPIYSVNCQRKTIRQQLAATGINPFAVGATGINPLAVGCHRINPSAVGCYRNQSVCGWFLQADKPVTYRNRYFLVKASS